MTIWALALILLAIIMLVGPIMMFRPSVRDRRLAALRQEAVSIGLQVRLASYRLQGKQRDVAIYSLPVVDLPSASAGWQLLRQAYTHDIHFYRQWQLQGELSPMTQATQASLKSFLDTLPASIVGVEVNHPWVCLWCLEDQLNADVNHLLTTAKALADLLR